MVSVALGQRRGRLEGARELRAARETVPAIAPRRPRPVRLASGGQGVRA